MMRKESKYWQNKNENCHRVFGSTASHIYFYTSPIVNLIFRSSFVHILYKYDDIFYPEQQVQIQLTYAKRASVWVIKQKYYRPNNNVDGLPVTRVDNCRLQLLLPSNEMVLLKKSHTSRYCRKR